MVLTHILQQGCIKVPLEGTKKEDAIRELVSVLNEQEQLLDHDMVLESVLLREKTRSTGIGSGIAIPHGKCAGVKELVMAIGVARQPIDFQSVDGKGVQIIILLVSPADQTGPHIQALARISRLMLNDDFKSALENADNPETVYELFSEMEAD